MAEAVTNVQDFLSEHWLAEVYPGKLKTLVAGWRTEPRGDKPNPLTALRDIARPYLQALADLPSPRDPEYDTAVTCLHGLLLDALGVPATPTEIATEQGDTPVTVPLRARVQGPTGEQLHVLQARPVETLEDLLGDDARVVEPLRVQVGPEKVETVTTPARAIQQLLLTADAPRYLLVVAGGWMVLTDVGRWAEGRYLAIDLLGALRRHDATPAGELATVAGLCSADVLLPGDDGTVAVDTFTQDSEKHAVAVSDDLREGLRDSVELIANEILDRRRAAGLPVEGVDELPRELTAQSLRFLYRVLFLLYAEARPELAILPVGAPEYGTGYGLDRLRDLVQVPLTGVSREGHHLHDSLSLLFRLVNEGHSTGHDGEGLEFEALRADLFDPARTPLVDGVRMRNVAVQQVLALLMLSKKAKRKNARRGFISYAALGINQLGAVYEGLMSYTGTIATEEMIELANDGNAEKGSWLVPSRRADEYDPDDLVRREDRLTGVKAPVRHRAGDFVFRLSGRDRQRSASYYTPEVLTRCVVKHALAELITEETTAADILAYRVCEPALGSGAFLNEALNQLARAYLEKAQVEQGRPVPPEDYAVELQKVKAYLALHRAYGVDLNATAVELAEVSVWLNVMYPGLKAPWFGLHLRRGNSLIGARRATYDLAALGRAKKSWLTTPPTDRALVDGPIGDGEIHHFLLPADGWAAVAGAKQARELRREQADALKAWKKTITRKPGTKEVERLRALARRVERLWTLTQRRLEISEREIARDIDVWGASLPSGSPAVTRERVEEELHDPGSPYRRLRWAMDAWCALWFWPLDGTAPPTMDEWLGGLEAVLGREVKNLRGEDKLGFFTDSMSFDDLAVADENERFLFDMKSEMGVLAGHPWLGRARDIADREGFFHWELDFAQVLARGGFDLQVGNPPWVRPIWREPLVLAEQEPSFILDDELTEEQFWDARNQTLTSNAGSLGLYCAELTRWAGISESVGDASLYPVLGGLQPNLYMNFMVHTWRVARSGGVACLLHPESHFVDPKGATLRRAAYLRLREYSNFIEASRWFDGVDSPTQTFGMHVYSSPQDLVRFRMITNLQAVTTLDESLDHQGEGPVPGIAFVDGTRDLRPHASRVQTITEEVLRGSALLFDERGTPPRSARLLRVLSREHQEIVMTASRSVRRVADLLPGWTSGWHEKGAKKAGIIRRSTEYPPNWGESVLQGPHFTVSTPFAKEPNENCQSKGDYTNWDLVALPSEVVPRTNYQRHTSERVYLSQLDQWSESPCNSFWRMFFRRMSQPGSERSLQPALFPPGPVHVDTVSSAAMWAKKPLEHGASGSVTRDTALVCGLCSSLPYDYLVKISGRTDIRADLVERFPAPLDHPAARLLLLRTLRLNCLTRDYSVMWADLFDREFVNDTWSASYSDWPSLSSIGPEWTLETPLRSEYERRAALVEIDALAAIMMDLHSEYLVVMFRTQFPILRKYEHEMYFDNQGQKIAKEFHAQGVKQHKDDYKLLQAYLRGEDCGDLLERYEPHPDGEKDPALGFVKPDREAEMRAAHAEFTERLGL